MLSCWEAGQLTSALLAASQHHRARTQDRQAWTAKRPFSSRLFLAFWARVPNSATRPVPGILSRWQWTGGVTRQIKKRMMTGSWLRIRWLSLILSFYQSHASHGPENRKMPSVCFRKVLSSFMTDYDAEWLTKKIRNMTTYRRNNNTAVGNRNKPVLKQRRNGSTQNQTKCSFKITIYIP